MYSRLIKLESRTTSVLCFKSEIALKSLTRVGLGNELRVSIFLGEFDCLWVAQNSEAACKCSGGSNVCCLLSIVGSGSDLVGV